MKTEFANQKVLLIFVQANSKKVCKCNEPKEPEKPTCKEL